MLRKNKKGFTLIELVMVIVILGILAAIAVPRYQDLRNEAHKSADAATIGAIRAGIMTYFAKNRTFPVENQSEAAFFAAVLQEKPGGWTYNYVLGPPNKGRIQCDGLPIGGHNATWLYEMEDGTVIPETPHP